MRQTKTLWLSSVLIAGMSIGSTAAADIWWEVGDQTLYFDDGIAGMGVFVFLDNYETNPDFKLFVDGMQDVYVGQSDYQTRPYSGYMVSYTSDFECGTTRTDPYGQVFTHWSTATLAFEQDENYFTLTLDNCGYGKYIDTYYGTPGL